MATRTDFLVRSVVRASRTSFLDNRATHRMTRISSSDLVLISVFWLTDEKLRPRKSHITSSFLRRDLCDVKNTLDEETGACSHGIKRSFYPTQRNTCNERKKSTQKTQLTQQPKRKDRSDPSFCQFRRLRSLFCVLCFVWKLRLIDNIDVHALDREEQRIKH